MERILQIALAASTAPGGVDSAQVRAARDAALPIPAGIVPADRLGLEIAGLRFEEFRDATDGGSSAWYDAFRLRDGRVILSVGDVASGKLVASTETAAIRLVVRGVASVHPDPRMILDAVERTLEGGALRGITSVSAWIGVLDPLDLHLHYASAGHPAPLLRGTDRVVRSLSSGDAALGSGTRTARSAYAVALAPGSALLLSTDGLIEADRDVIRPATPVKDAFALLDGAARPETLREMARGGRAHRPDVALLYVGIDHAGGAADGVLSWAFEADDALEGRRVRHAVAGALLALGYSDEAVLDAELVFGELVGNAVRHAGGRVEIRLDGSLPNAVLHVLDEGRGFSRNPKLSDTWAEGGRGLALIEFLVDDFSVSHRAGRGAHARAVLRRTQSTRTSSAPSRAQRDDGAACADGAAGTGRA